MRTSARAALVKAGVSTSDDLSYVSHRDDFELLFQERWFRHIAPDLQLHTMAALGRNLQEIEAKLDEAVAAARTEGVS
ncbi:hypothetical protein [Arthrobacter sp. StoSoilB20]|uniref:hypothetical protein n=1 Tax=Arthrobacter sp. StoSoilB20 TaxID=2830995 RepID=UPI001CC57F0B|nr:hypothetical protein [Arthrobacter sp. StoSoilB20]